MTASMSRRFLMRVTRLVTLALLFCHVGQGMISIFIILFSNLLRVATQWLSRFVEPWGCELRQQSHNFIRWLMKTGQLTTNPSRTELSAKHPALWSIGLSFPGGLSALPSQQPPPHHCKDFGK